MTTPTDRAAQCAWQQLADSCLDHDCPCEQRAVEWLRELGQIPEPREGE